MKHTKHLYKSFFALAIGQSFLIGRKKLAVKRGMFSCQVIGGSIQTVAPWRKVRTTQPVKTLRPPSGILRNVEQRMAEEMGKEIHKEIAEGKYWSRAKDCVQSFPTTGAPLRDPMVQDHTPEKTSDEQQRTL